MALRWRDPRLAVPVRLWVFALKIPETWLNGERIEGARPLLPFGETVLAMRFDGLARRPGVFAILLEVYEGPPASPTSDAEPSSSHGLVTTSDGAWMYTSREPCFEGW